MIASVFSRHFRKVNLRQKSFAKKHFSTTSLFCHDSMDKNEEAQKKRKEPLQNEKYMKLRFETFAQMKNLDSLYPHKFTKSMSIDEFVQKFDHLQPTEIDKNQVGHFFPWVRPTFNLTQNLTNLNETAVQ